MYRGVLRAFVSSAERGGMQSRRTRMRHWISWPPWGQDDAVTDRRAGSAGDARRVSGGFPHATRRGGLSRRGFFFGGGGRNSAGSTIAPFSDTPQCRCGPVTRPVAPTSPSTSPRFSSCPTSRGFSTGGSTWSRALGRDRSSTLLPLKKYVPTSTTRPASGALMGVPVGAAMSMPECGLRDSPLNMRRSPNELERRPGTG